MMLLPSLLLASGGAAALLLPAGAPLVRPGAAVRVRMQFASPPDLNDPLKFPKGPDGETLITYASLDSTGVAMIEMALASRNKERILSGEPKYESVQAMIDAYIEFEGRDKGMSAAQCEDAVLRFLQRRALLSEGGADFKDPQTVVTFALLGVILIGAAYNLAVNGLPQS